MADVIRFSYISLIQFTFFFCFFRKPVEIRKNVYKNAPMRLQSDYIDIDIEIDTSFETKQSLSSINFKLINTIEPSDKLYYIFFIILICQNWNKRSNSKIVSVEIGNYWCVGQLLKLPILMCGTR